MRSPFHPLHYLKYELRLHLELDSKRNIVVHGMNDILSKKMQAKKILAIYNDLLLMQLDAPHENATIRSQIAIATAR